MAWLTRRRPLADANFPRELSPRTFPGASLAPTTAPEDLPIRTPAGDTPLELVERVRIGRGEVHPGHAVEEHWQIGTLGTGQEHGDHRTATLVELSKERRQLLVLPGAYPRADDYHRRRDALDLVLQHPLPR